jgi:integrase/recombinase XerD
MINAMPMHGFSPRTHDSYLAAVRDLAKFTRRSPDTLAHADLTRYFEHLVRQRGLAPASARLFYNGIRFLYLNVLGWPAVDLEVTLPKRPQRIPDAAHPRRGRRHPRGLRQRPLPHPADGL